MSEIQSDSEAIATSLSDPSAFGVIFERHYDAVHGYLQRRLDGPFADELAAQTFLVAFDGRSRFDRSHPDSRPWLFGIATNLARNHRRREVVELRAIAAMAPESGAGVDGGCAACWPRRWPTSRPRSQTCSASSSGRN
jgi:RNA polymerase sigma-70 factor (ECF subfamily)